MNDYGKANLILSAQAHYLQARWWQLACAWIFGQHKVIHHLGRVARISFWRDRPYLLTFRELP